jgi:hypothetical protein
MRLVRSGLLLGLLGASLQTLPAQQPPATPAKPAQPAAPAGPKDAIRNGGFERTLQSPNLWTGVDREGFLAGFRGFLPVLNEGGNIADTPMPVSVAAGDLNGDGLVDLLSADPVGYTRIYFNSGSKEQPKFTMGELTLPFLALPEGAPPWVPPGLGGPEGGNWALRWAKRRQGVRVGLTDTTKTGKLDLVAGNYFGEIFFLPNRGSSTLPQFAQPQPVSKGMVPTMKDPTHRWGNVFAPVLHDWDGDNKPDLLVGEGSYSANNVHLFLNQGSAAAPVFSEQKRQPLALGEGREQLSPALADANGDGLVDVLVADRRGRITVYPRPKDWKFGDTIKPAGFLGKDGALTQNGDQALTLGSGIHTIATGDLNGDGLFDLVAGRSNGRIAWAVNKGTKDAPKFEAATDLTGDKPVPASWMLPSQWDVETGSSRGNFYAFANAVAAADDPAAAPVEGTRALKFGFAPTPNKLLPRPSLLTQASVDFKKRQEDTSGDGIFRDSSEGRAVGAPNNFFVLRQQVQFEIGKTYTLSFSAKGSGLMNGRVLIGWRGYKQLGEDRIVRGERGAVTRQRETISESAMETLDFRPSGSWSSVTRQVKIEFKKERELNKEKTTSEGLLEISFELTAPDGVLYLDNIKLVPAG